MRMLAAASALILVALTGAADQRRDKVPPATPAGKAVDCIRLNDVRSTQVRDDQTIDFITRGGQVYRNALDYSCPGLGFERRFAHQTSTSDYCSTDMITVLYTSGPVRGPSCGLGKFQPVTLDKSR
jgi:hypothetical protein